MAAPGAPPAAGPWTEFAQRRITLLSKAAGDEAMTLAGAEMYPARISVTLDYAPQLQRYVKCQREEAIVIIVPHCTDLFVYAPIWDHFPKFTMQHSPHYKP